MSWRKIIAAGFRVGRRRQYARVRRGGASRRALATLVAITLIIAMGVIANRRSERR
jgi:hypothetical protein